VGRSASRMVEGYGYTPSNDVTPPLRILSFAYACKSGQVSQPRAGWAWSRMLARLGETWVSTRRDDRTASEVPAEALPRPPDATRAADLR